MLVLAQASLLLGESSAPTPAAKAEPVLKWRTKVIPIALSASLLKPSSNIKSGSDLVGAVRRALRAWEEAGGVEFREVFSDRLNASPQGPAGDGVSLITVAPTAENALLFAKNADEIAATTRVFFDGKGRISEADVVLNPYQQFSSDGTFGTFDLEATITHEIGHALGLEHSAVRGSVMYENFGKNGVFGMQAFAYRSISEIDRAAIRAKYGTPEGVEKCCGTVSARLSFPEGRAASAVDIWLEDSATGKIAAQAVTGADGSVEISGLSSGTYKLFSFRRDRAKRPVPSQEIGTVAVSPGETSSLAKKLESGTDDLDIKYTGFNGQLTVNAVPVNAGKSYTVYIGGRNLTPKGTSVRFSSPLISVNPSSIVSHDYGDDISVLSFEVSIDAETPVGEYAIFVESAAGGRASAAGGIAVTSVPNPFSNFVLDGKIF